MNQTTRQPHPTRRRLRRFTPILLLTALLAAMLSGCFGDSGNPKGPDPIDPGPGPVITRQPRDTTLFAGGTATFSVTATGALTYQWIRNQTDTLASETAASIMIANTALGANGNTYKCLVGNADGTVASSFAILTVEAPATSLTPEIVVQPVDRIVAPGGSTSFTVTAAGSGLTYTWLRGPTEAIVPGATSATLVLNGVPEILNGMVYRCVVRNTHGVVTSQPATLRVDVLRSTLLTMGQTVFSANCTGCHGAQGRGSAGGTPPLAYSDFLMNNRIRVIEMLLQGTSDTLRVNGALYQGNKPAMSEILTDTEIASVLTYIRAVLNDSTVVSCNQSVLDSDGFPTCQKTARTSQDIAIDSISFREVSAVRDRLFPL